MLITNLSLSARSGTELYARDLALELLRRGHLPSVYSPLLGAVADELRADGVRVTDHLAEEHEQPHVIHGHHHIELMTALFRFPAIPAVFVCHDRTAWHDRPPIHPRIRRYIAVDENCRERFDEEGIDSGRVHVIPNAVDLTRFRTRDPLSEQPRRALLFSHYAAEHTHLPAVRETCRRVGLELHVVGSASGQPHARPEELLHQFDIVFAKARCALEAMAVGCAVVLCDHLGAGPRVQSRQWASLRRFNFGRRTCGNPLKAEWLLAEVAHYDAADAAEVCRLTRASASVERLADTLVALYRDVIQEQASTPPPKPDEEPKAAAEYLRRQLSYQLVTRLVGAEIEREHWKASAELAHRGWAELQREYDQLRVAHDAAQHGWNELHAEYERILAECRRLQALVNAPRAA